MDPGSPCRLRARQRLGLPGAKGLTNLAANERVVLPRVRRRPPSAKPVRLQLPHGLVGGESRKADLVFLPDDSGSMYGTWGDEQGVRYAAALSVIDLMRRIGGGRAAVVHWGTEAPADQVLPLTNVRLGMGRLRKALQIPPTLGGNNFPAALDRAAEVLEGSDRQRLQLVFGVTDGIEYLSPGINASLARLPAGSVHVLLVDRSGGCNEELERQWRALPLGSFTRLDVLDTTRMAWQIADVTAAALGLSMPELKPPTPTQKERAT